VIWPLLMISTLSHLPSYPMIQSALEILTILNPAEMIRVFSVMRMGAGSMLGASYHDWITWAEGSSALSIFIATIAVWILVCLIMSGGLWKRGEQRATE